MVRTTTGFSLRMVGQCAVVVDSRFRGNDIKERARERRNENGNDDLCDELGFVGPDKVVLTGHSQVAMPPDRPGMEFCT